jgi:hypothetical protein
VGDGQALCQRHGFVAADPTLGTAFASMWLHDPDHVAHVAGNVVALGNVFEPVLGRGRLLALFVASACRPAPGAASGTGPFP